MDSGIEKADIFTKELQSVKLKLLSTKFHPQMSNPLYISKQQVFLQQMSVLTIQQKKKGKNSGLQIQHIKQHDSVLTSKQEMPNILEKAFEKISLLQNCLPAFRIFRLNSGGKKFN